MSTKCEEMEFKKEEVKLTKSEAKELDDGKGGKYAEKEEKK